jgi:Glycosyl transferase 4-like domain
LPLRILLLTCHLEPSDPASERWAHLSQHLQDQGLNMVLLEVQAGRAFDALALEQAQRLHEQQAFDVVISNGPPIAAHLTAQAFSRMTGIAWVADWSEPFALLAHKMAPSGPFALESHKLTGWFDRQLEIRLVRAADQVLVSSEALARKYRAFRGDRDASLLLVRNGFERSELRSVTSRGNRERLRIVCSQSSDFNPVPLLESLQTRANLRESLEVIFTRPSLQVAGLVEEFELDDCVHCLEASDPESLALEVSADALLSFGLNSAYRSPAGLARVLARQRPILHVFESAADPSFEVLTGTSHLPAQNNRFALTAALEMAIQHEWIMPQAISGAVEQYCWDVLAQALGGFVCLAGADRAGSDRVVSQRASSDQVGPAQVGPAQVGPAQVGLDRADPDRISPDRVGPDRVGPEAAGSSTVPAGLARQTILGVTAKI